MPDSSLARPVPRLALNRTEVAIAIGVSVSSVDQMVREGALPSPRKWRSRKLWLVTEIEACLSNWPSADNPGNLLSSESRLIDQWMSESEGNDAGKRRLLPGESVMRHYEELGFDPRTMDDAAYRRLHSEAEQRWRAKLPLEPLNKRERGVLVQMANYGIDVPVHFRSVKGCGPDTEERLVVRGFLETRNQTKFPDRIESYILTAAGMAAAKAIDPTADY